MTLFDVSPGEGVDVGAEGPRSDPLTNPQVPFFGARPGPLRRIVLALSYDGSAFHGFAAQPGQETVGGALVDRLEKRFGPGVRLTCAGRTDTGVHALSQVVHLDVEEEILRRIVGDELEAGSELSGLARSLSTQLRPHVVVYHAAIAPVGFDARRSALARRYRYDLETSTRIDPLRAKGCWHVGTELDLNAMRIATDPLIGEHDFAGFCRQPDGAVAGALRRRVFEARWAQMEPGWLRFEIEAQAFCHQMVRAIVGELVEIGQHRRSPALVTARLRSAKRDGAAKLAPANGLCLVAVRYPAELGGTFS